MGSLSPDGGMVALMAVRVEKMYPLAFMNKEKGKGVPPWSEAEEYQLQDQWKVCGSVRFGLKIVR